MTPPVIELRGLARTYPGPPPVPALRPADLVIEAGDYVAVTGPSGSGKSTLLHLLGLLDVPTEGSYLLDGLDTTALSDRDRSALRGRRIGFVFQAFHLLPYRTALENVLLAELYNQTSRGDRVPGGGRGAGRGRARAPARRAAHHAVRRGVPAGRDSAGAGEPAEPAAVRRADRQPGLAERGRADGAARPAERGRLHHRGDHARRPGGGARPPGRSTSATGCCPSVVRPVMPRRVDWPAAAPAGRQGRGRRGGRGDRAAPRPGRADHARHGPRRGRVRGRARHDRHRRRPDLASVHRAAGHHGDGGGQRAGQRRRPAGRQPRHRLPRRRRRGRAAHQRGDRRGRLVAGRRSPRGRTSPARSRCPPRPPRRSTCWPPRRERCRRWGCG